MPRPPVKALLQMACGAALLAFLLWQATRSEAVGRLLHEEKDPPRLVAAVALLVASIALSFVRWRLIARAAGLAMGLGEAVRLGAIGFATNFIALGNVGGDVVKAALVARGRPGARAVAVSTVLVDRLMGLFALLLFAGGAIVATGLAGDASPEAPEAIRVLSRSTLVVTAIAVACFVVAIAPGRPLLRIASRLRRVPVLGVASHHAASIACLYQRGWPWMLAALGVGLVTDGLFILSFYAVATGLPMASPGAAEHFLIVPLSMIAGALPISPSGLGTVEAAVEMLYRSLGAAAGVAEGDGTLVALGHRLVMLAVGALAAAYYVAACGAERAAARRIASANDAARVTGES